MATLKTAEEGNDMNESESNQKKQKDFFEMMEIDQRKLGRISRGIHSKAWIIYPDDRFRPKWDLVITV